MKEYKKYATTIDIDLYNYVKNNKKNKNFCYGCTSAIESMFVDEFNDNYLTLTLEERLNYLHNIEEICKPSFSDNSIYCDNLEKINTETVKYEKGSLKNLKDLLLQEIGMFTQVMDGVYEIKEKMYFIKLIYLLVK